MARAVPTPNRALRQASARRMSSKAPVACLRRPRQTRKSSGPARGVALKRSPRRSFAKNTFRPARAHPVAHRSPAQCEVSYALASWTNVALVRGCHDFSRKVRASVLLRMPAHRGTSFALDETTQSERTRCVSTEPNNKPLMSSELPQPQKWLECPHDSRRSKIKISRDLMQTMTTTNSSSTPSSSPKGDGRALRILAKSVYRELRSSGHSRSDIVGFTNELLELVTSDIRDDGRA